MEFKKHLWRLWNFLLLGITIYALISVYETNKKVNFNPDLSIKRGDTYGSIIGILIPCVSFYVVLMKWIFKLGLFKFFIITISLLSLLSLQSKVNHPTHELLHEKQHLDLMDNYVHSHFGHVLLILFTNIWKLRISGHSITECSKEIKDHGHVGNLSSPNDDKAKSYDRTKRQLFKRNKGKNSDRDGSPPPPKKQCKETTDVPSK